MTRIYGEIESYHGHDAGVMEITDREMIEWAYIPHFYYNFYVYQYATSIAGAAATHVDRLNSGSDAARDTYIKFLEAGGSDYARNPPRSGTGRDFARPLRRRDRPHGRGHGSNRVDLGEAAAVELP